MILPALLAAASLAVQSDTGALTLALDGRPIIAGTLAQDKLQVAHADARQDSPTHATVRVNYTNGASALYTYTLDGRDCTLDYALTNTSPEPQTIDLSGWMCAFETGVSLKGTLSY